MGIFDILFRNTGQKARTLRPENQSVPAGFRGALEHETSLCIGCRTCAYVCSPGAITLETQPDGIAWQYLAARCTFCSRCAEYCPTGAIRLEPAPLAGLVTEPDMAQHLVAYQHCERCDRPFVALPVPVLEQLMRREVTGAANDSYNIDRLMRLCEKCRSRVTSQQLKDSLIGKQKDAR